MAGPIQELACVRLVGVWGSEGRACKMSLTRPTEEEGEG